MAVIQTAGLSKRYFFFQEKVSARRQLKADAPHGLDIAVRAAGAQLGADVADMDSDGLVLHSVRLLPDRWSRGTSTALSARTARANPPL